MLRGGLVRCLCGAEFRRGVRTRLAMWLHEHALVLIPEPCGYELCHVPLLIYPCKASGTLTTELPNDTNR